MFVFGYSCQLAFEEVQGQGQSQWQGQGQYDLGQGQGKVAEGTTHISDMVSRHISVAAVRSAIA